MTKPFDPFYGNRQARGPAQTAFPITPADNLPLAAITSGIYVGGAGNLAVYLRDDNYQGTDEATGAAAAPVIFYNVAAGTYLPLAVKIVMQTGTTATNIVGCV